jgi:hypothetical protein
MPGVFLEDDLFLPLEGMDALVIGRHRDVDVAAQLPGLVKMAPASELRLSRLNQISAWLSHEAWVGM